MAAVEMDHAAEEVWPEDELAEDAEDYGVEEEAGEQGLEEEVCADGEEYLEVDGEDFAPATPEEGAPEAAEASAKAAAPAARSARTPGNADEYQGLIITVGGTTGNMLIKCFKVTEEYGKEAIVLKSQYPEAQLGDRVRFQVTAREGQRPLARDLRVIGHVDLNAPPTEKGKKGKGAVVGGKGAVVKGKGQAKGKDSGKGKGKRSKTFYAGRIKSKEGAAYFIDCDVISELLGSDAWFYEENSPAGINIGSVVTFTVNESSAVGVPPEAFGVAPLRISRSLLSGASAGKNGTKGKGKSKGKAKVGAGKGKAVRKTIVKTIE